MNENMLPIGTLLRGDSYRIEKQIGAGGFGNTYAVRNLSFDEVYAMKEFFMKDINLRDGKEVTVSIPNNRSTFESLRNKFMKEARRLRKLNNVHIVKVHDLFEENGTVYYVMDLIDGQSLADFVKQNGPMDELTAMNVFRQMLEALKVVHCQDPMMLHLDIKPSNIMLDKADNAYLLDFGSSKLLEPEQYTATTGFTYTPGYAPSELVDGNKNRIGPWTDLYELGATLYYLLTGLQPPSVSEIQDEGHSVFSFPETVSKESRELILWMTAVSRKERPKSVEEVLQRLDDDGNKEGSEPLYTITTSETVTSKGKMKKPDEDETILNTSGSTEGIKQPSVAPMLSKAKSSGRNVDSKPNKLRRWAIVGGLALLIVLSSIFFSTGNRNSEAVLKTDIDTMSYAIGLAQTQGLKEYIVGTLGVDTAYIDDFVKGLNEGVDAGNSKEKVSYYAGIQIGQQVGSRMIPGINNALFGEDSTRTISFDNFMAGFINGSLGDESLMTIDSAQVLSNRLLGTTNDSEEENAADEQNKE